MMDRDFYTNATPHTNFQTNFMETNDPYSDLAAISNDAFALRELIGKLGAGSNSSPYDSGQTTPPHLQRGSMGSSVPIPTVAADPGFAERAAKFSCFGSKSFNGRTAPIGEFVQQNRSPPPLKLPRVSSSPALKQQQQQGGMNVGSEKKFSKLAGSGGNSGDEMESSVSEQISNEMMSSRKRKGVSTSRGKGKQDEDGNAKRAKVAGENAKNENGGTKVEEDGNAKAEPPKDYIHVRARRGQATDSHSLAERVRREKISERMKLLQDLVPGCNKVTGKALMLDEIINYVQSLQRQVEFLSMKLASVNPELDFNMDNVLTKDMLQQNGNVSQEMYPLDTSAPMYNHNHHQSHQNVQPPQLQISTVLDHVVPLDAPLCGRNLGLQLPSLDGFSEFAAFGEDELQSIVQMGFVQSPANFPVQYQTSNMKVEL